jgi:hypothetical protein
MPLAGSRSVASPTLANIAVKLAIVLASSTATLEQRRRWHRLLSGEGIDPNVAPLTLKRGSAC